MALVADEPLRFANEAMDLSELMAEMTIRDGLFESAKRERERMRELARVRFDKLIPRGVSQDMVSPGWDGTQPEFTHEI